jgi:hypothetical protein
MIDSITLEAGRPWPLGAHWDGKGVNFALFSAHAEGVELCVFDGMRMRPLPLRECSDQVWHGYLVGAAPGLRYAYRVHGLHAPEQGQRFDAQRLLLDPYAREVVGRFSWPAQNDPAHCLTAAVVDEEFTWGEDTPPATPWSDTVLYEVHVKGISRQHSRDTRGAARQLCRSCCTGDDRTFPAPRYHRPQSPAGALFSRRATSGQRRSRQLLGLQLARLLRAGTALRRAHWRSVGDRRVQEHGPVTACRGPRSHSRRGFQPYRGNRRVGPDPVFPWHR